MAASNVRRVFLGAVIGATGLALAAPFTQPGVAAASSSSVYARGTTGVVAPSHHAAAPTGQTAAHAQRGVRSTPRSAGAASSHLSAPAATAAVASVPSSLLQNFDGTSSNDSRKTNFNQQFEPPDQGLCVGNGFVLEPVNSAFRIFKTNGHSVIGPTNVNDLFDEGSTQFTSDPRCYYDPSTNTWFATILFLSGGEIPDGHSSHLDIAVNSSGNPENIWTQYQIDTTDAGGNGCPCFGDQPTLGIDQSNLYVTTNEFSILGPEFNGANIYAFSKKDLVAGRSVHFAHFANLMIAGTSAASVQPAESTGSPRAEFFLSSLDPTGTTDNRIGVWAMTDRTALQHGGLPKLSSTVITSETYGVPPNVAQKGSSSLINSGDDRMQQTQYINGTIWGELTTVVPPGRAGAAWFSVRPSLSGGHVSGAVIEHQGYVVDAGNNVIYPALESTSAGNVAMVFTVTGTTHFPSAAYAVLGAGQSAFGAVNIAAAGTGPYSASSSRWGDYSWAVVDPTDQAVWLATEYMPPKSSQTPNGVSNWGTRVLEVAVG